MQIIMKLAKERRTQGLHQFVEDIYHRVSLSPSIQFQLKILNREKNSKKTQFPLKFSMLPLAFGLTPPIK